MVRIAGFVVKNDKEGISIAQGYGENGQYTGHFFVPAGMIRKIRKVKI